jgi:hypothetical protein
MKKRYWIEFFLWMLTLSVAIYCVCEGTSGFIQNHENSFPISCLFLRANTVRFFLLYSSSLTLLFWFLSSRVFSFVKKSIQTPWKFWCAYQGSMIGVTASTIIWALTHLDYFQKAFLFRVDFVVGPLIVGIVLFLIELRLPPQTTYGLNQKSRLAEEPIESEEEDLINNSPAIDEIVSSITSSLRTGQKVIAIYGPNGIGKTSCINLAMKKIKGPDVYIKYFDAYKYASELEMIKSFFSTLLKPLDENFILPGANTISKKLTTMLYGISGKTSVFQIDFGKFYDFFVGSEDFYSLKENVEAYLLALNKKIVIVVDDIDRCSVKKRHLFFQIISATKSFKNILIVISASADELLSKNDPEMISIID